MWSRGPWFILGSTLLLGFSVFGQEIFEGPFGTTFNPDNPSAPSAEWTPYKPGFTLSGQQGWATDDPAQPDFVGRVIGYSNPWLPTERNMWVMLGGLTNPEVPPIRRRIHLWRPFRIHAAASARFQVEFAVASRPSRPQRDSFAWTFRSRGTQLFRLGMEPLPDIENAYGMVFHDWNDELIPGAAGGGFFMDAKYLLDLQIHPDGESEVVTARLTNSSGTSSGMVVPGTRVPKGTAALLTEVAATWLITDEDPANYGGNTLLINDFFTSATEWIPWVDSSGDGIPDYWKEQYDLDIFTDHSHIDSDGDGFTDLEEFQMQTNPLAPMDRLTLAIAATDAHSHSLRWNAVRGVFYRLQSAAHPGGPWHPRHLFAPDATGEFETVLPPTNGDSFFRLQTLQR